MSRRRVLILNTGGTLGMRPREPEHTLAPDEFGPTLIEHVPEVAEIAEIETRSVFNIDSTDMTPRHWKILAQHVAEVRGQFDGVVITHGTDAMAYTASALSFLLRDLDFPVILTGSQRPLADARSDGRGNIVGAVDLAVRAIPEVAIYFHGLLLRGNRATKTSSFAYGAFESPNFQPLAEVGTRVKMLHPPLTPSGPFRLTGDFDQGLAVLRLVPGQSSAALLPMLEADISAVLLVAFGVGNLPTEDPAVGDAVARAVASGKVVAIAGQPPHGCVDLGAYIGGRLAHDKGAVGTGDMTIEAATVKLMYLLATKSSPQAVQEALCEPLAGEVGDG
jgi:L-asparaginase